MSYNGTPGRRFIDLAEDRPATPVGQTAQYARNTYVKIADHWTTLGGKEVVKGDFGLVSDYYWARATQYMPAGFVYTVELLGAGCCTPGIHEIVLEPYP
ncbi:hypothetical protein DFP72DRAFT_1174063 [Ephemerocybe angulata]|uniref:Uncharacterized protein n=1 Tax=Ephemerocybe angulata TaxID=980116 RepID=A0A8H6LZF7_9AGAR|nr:hypothetical protein DFP72DRAFT_1174063 [Tulosesus angulatus]